uniref:B30.2/SPRY domain-containing protein n=1 Tax=Anopheles atroparvus TaxID=41427 RepID=A0AAG5D106_ANOAO
MDLAKLKVADLKAELAARNLDTKGVKAVLLERLKEAIERETNAASNLTMGDQQQFQAQQQQQFSLQQQVQAQQQMQLQQQLLLQQQEQQQLLLLQQQQQQQNAMPTELLAQPQEQTIEDLSMPTKRVDTPVRRRSTRRSMTRSPSPTNTTGENPHASLMGSARKRGRSRSMTKSPSPQRVTSEAPCLASVQEEPEPTIGTEQRLAGAEVPAEVTPVSIEDSLPAKVEESIAPPVEDAPLAPTLDELDSLLESDEQSDLLKGSVMEVDEGDSLAESELLESDCEEEKADEKTEKKTEGKTEETQSTDVAEVTAAPVDETPATGDQDTVAINDDTKVNAEEPPKSVEQSETDTTTATESAAAEDKPNVESSNAVEKKQTSAQQAQNTMVEFVSEENEPQLATETDSTVTLSWYDSDLNLAIDDQDLLSAKPLTDGIFGLVWAGVRATRGVLGGKVFYEVLVADELQPATRSPLIPEGEKTTPELRIGWSTGIAGARQLGETDHSYGYASSGKKVVGGNFEEYGVAYGKNDVVGVYLDLESTPCRMEFTVNRVRQGEAFQFTKESLCEKALFPHVYAKNLSFQVNFGTVVEGFPLLAEAKKETPAPVDEKPSTTVSSEEATKEESKDEAAEDATEKKEEITSEETPRQESQEADTTMTEPTVTESVPFDAEYTFLNSLAENNGELVQEGPKGPAARDCCELIMMIGLPGSGKTHWATNYLKENATNAFTVLSIDSLLENMKVDAKPREPSNTPQWEKIINQLSRNMTRLIEIACKRRRNFIIDQTNVFASEQKRRLKGFGGFKTRRAVAVVPSVEEYKRRYELKVAKYGKEVPDTTLNTMKANIFVPSLVQNWYTELLFPELPEAEAQEAIKKLNEEGRKLLPPRRNRANQSNRQKHNNNANNNYTSRWNHNRPGQGGQQQYGKNRYGGAGGAPTGGYNRYGGHKVNEGAQQQYGHHRGGDYRSGGGNGYGRRDDHHHRGGNYGGGGGNRYDSWTRNSGGGGYYNDRGYSNRGYHQQPDHSNNRYDARRRDRRGYNNGSGWNAQGSQSQQWNNYPKSGNSDSWYMWWQDH